MRLLQELYRLHEGEMPGENHVELANLVKHFPSNYKKAIEKLFGGPRLTYHGIPFHPDSGKGIEDLVTDAINEWHTEGGTIECNVPDVEYTPEDSHEPQTIEVSYEDDSVDPVKDGQEVYMGYDSNHDQLYVGYDVHFNEEVFNDEWDKAFEEATDEKFDYDEPTHQKAFTAAHKHFIGLHPWVLFQLKWDGDSFKVEDVQYGAGSFYHDGHHVAQEKGLVDLRVD